MSWNWLRFGGQLPNYLVLKLTGKHFSCLMHISSEAMGIWSMLHFSGPRLMHWLWSNDTAAADMATVTNYLSQVGRNIILQNPAPSSPQDPTNSAHANFINQTAASLCPDQPNCATLAVAGATPGTSPTNFDTRQSLRLKDTLANILNKAAVAMALGASTPRPGAGFVDFFNEMAANLNRQTDIAGNTFLANFLTQLAVTLAV